MTKIISGKNVLMSVVILLLTMMTFNQSAREEVIRAELKVAKFVDPKQIICMATNIFYEAGSESTNGKAAVARVTLNRVNSGFANTPCNVVYQATIRDDRKLCQFSWVCEGKGNPNKHSPSYQASLQVAYEVLVLDKYKDVVPKNTLFFHNKSVEPDWEHYEKVQVIGNHIFYSKKKKSNNAFGKKHKKHRYTTSSEFQPPA
jgi:spore germination cell wall hydrolase CwlJ-like protein